MSLLMSQLLNKVSPLATTASPTSVKTGVKTSATLIQKGINAPFTQDQVMDTASEAMAANAQYKGQAEQTMLKAAEVAKQSEQDRKQYRTQQQEQLSAQKDQGTLMMRETARKVDANQEAYQEFNEQVGNSEFMESRNLLMQQYTERQRDLANAAKDQQEGGVLESIWAAVRASYHGAVLQELGQAVQGSQAIEMQAGQQLLMNLQKNAAAVGDIFAVEKQQNVNRVELAATLQKMSADGVQLNRDSMSEMASLLGISSEVANTAMKDFNVMIATNNASSSIFQTKLQELQMQQSQLNLDRTKRAYDSEKETDEAMEGLWKQYTTILGTKNAPTFKVASAIASETKQPSPELVNFGLWLGRNKEQLSIEDAVLAKKGNAPLTKTQEFALNRGNLAVGVLNREQMDKNSAESLNVFPVPMRNVGGKMEVDTMQEQQVAKSRAQWLAQKNAETTYTLDNPAQLGEIERKAKILDVEYNADKNTAYAQGVIVDSPVQEVVNLAKTPGPARELLKSKLSPEVMAKLEAGEFNEISTTVTPGKPPAADVYSKISFAVKEATKATTFAGQTGAGQAETIAATKQKIKQQAEVVAAGWAVKVATSSAYKDQNFVSAVMKLPVPSADGSPSSELVEIDMTNPSAVYYYMEQMSQSSITEMLRTNAIPLGGF